MLELEHAADAFVRILRQQSHEIEQLLLKNRELEFRLVDLSQRQMNVIGVMDEWVPKLATCPEMTPFFVSIGAALKRGDD